MNLIVVLFLLLVSLSMAKEQSLNMGQYNVSFDLNTTLAYNSSNTSFKDGGTFGGTKYQTCSVWLNSTNNFALLTIAQFDDAMNGDLTSTESSISEFLNELGYEVTLYNITIDGRNGILGIGEDYNGDSMFAAQYWYSQKSCSNNYLEHNYTNVLIESNYPWNNATFSLLKSIHIVWPEMTQCKKLN
jgi:hypothetical protein